MRNSNTCEIQRRVHRSSSKQEFSALQDDLERQELRTEMAMSELGRHKQQKQGAAAAADAATGIDAFEMTLKRLGAEGNNEGE